MMGLAGECIHVGLSWVDVSRAFIAMVPTILWSSWP